MKTRLTKSIYKKGMDRSNNNNKNIYIPVPYKKPISLRKILKNFLEKVQKDQQAEKYQTKRVTGLGRRTG